MCDGPPAVGDITPWLEREVAAVQASGRLDAEVEFVPAYGHGLPTGTAEAVERAFMELARQQDIVMIAGPAIGDNALIATPLVERERVPTINWAGAERARGEYMFHLQVGSHEDESLVMARHMLAIGAKRLGVVYDQSPIGTRHLKYLEDEARIIGMEIVAAEAISPLEEDASGAVDKVLAGKPDGFVYLGPRPFGTGSSAAAGRKGLAGSAHHEHCGHSRHGPRFRGADRRLDLCRHVFRPEPDTGRQVQGVGRSRRKRRFRSPRAMTSADWSPKGWRGRRSLPARASRPGWNRSNGCPPPRARKAPRWALASRTAARCTGAIWCCGSGWAAESVEV